MARPDLPARPGRLAAVLGPPVPPSWSGSPGGEWPLPAVAGPGPADEPPTEPLPAIDAAPERVEPVVARGPGSLLQRLVPDRWRGARLDAGRSGATALALIAAAAAVVAAVGVWTQRPRVEPVGRLPAVSVVSDAAAPGPVTGSVETGPAPTPAQPDAPLVVSVSGKVARPGLVEVPDGARVADVLEAAGGALPGTDLTGLNLARKVVDGEQVSVGVPPAADAASAAVGGGAPGGGAAGPAGKVDLNAATAEQLEALPGVGPVTAQRILDWRTRNGRFTRVEQLREVDGIGERRFATLRELVTT